ncbi:unnamed protein product [Closterium sp. NIES-53]
MAGGHFSSRYALVAHDGFLPVAPPSRARNALPARRAPRGARRCPACSSCAPWRATVPCRLCAPRRAAVSSPVKAHRGPAHPPPSPPPPPRLFLLPVEATWGGRASPLLSPVMAPSGDRASAPPVFVAALPSCPSPIAALPPPLTSLPASYRPALC